MSWSSILGQDEALRRLRTSFARGRLAHAFAFVGPEGIGKRLFALELAKAFLCEASPAALTACDRCAACSLVAAETHPDFHVARKPEEKSELPVEAIRTILHKLGLKPTRGHGSVVLVENADDFNEESANAFLKTLEEPPNGTEIVLLSTGIERLLPTIRSRVQVVPFRPLSPTMMDELLTQRGIDDLGRRKLLIETCSGSVGRATALDHPAVWAFREALIAQLRAEHCNPVQLARLWMEFAESAGKEVPAQRARAALGIPFVLNHLQGELKRDAAAGASQVERIQMHLEACQQAQYYFDRRVQIVLVVEQLADRLCAI